MSVALIDVSAHRGRIGEAIDAGIARVVEHGQWIMGPEVAALESALAEWVGGGVHALGCANGTDALVLGLQALGLQPGDAVVCPAFTFVATAEAVAVAGGVPVFADVEEHSFNLDPASVTAAVLRARSNHRRVVGVIAVDLFGRPADYRALREVTDAHGLWLLADAAQSFGGASPGGIVGTLADVTTTSFFPAKPLGCYGDGGALFTADEHRADVIRSLRVHGKGSDKYDNIRIGQNSRLDTIQAAILLPKLAILHDELVARQRVADRYANGLADVATLPGVPHGHRSAWAQYTIVTDRREQLQRALNDKKIGNAVYYPTPLHQQTAYAQFHRGGIELPCSELLAGRVLSLPMHPYLTDEQLDTVISAVVGALAPADLASAG